MWAKIKILGRGSILLMGKNEDRLGLGRGGGGLKRKKAVKKLLVKEKRGSGKSTTTKYVFWNMSVKARGLENKILESF